MAAADARDVSRPACIVSSPGARAVTSEVRTLLLGAGSHVSEIAHFGTYLNC